MDRALLYSLLFTDLYELKMVQAYLHEQMQETAVFELYFRQLPEQRNFVIAAGLSDLLDYLEHLEISQQELQYLQQQEQVSPELLEFLRSFRFTGDIYAVPEGTPVFPNEPLVQVVAPIAQAQLVETLVLNQIHFQSVAATKAARVVLAAQGRNVVDFGARRAHGSDAALKVARTCYLVGGAGTSLVAAGQKYGIPIFGTMAHSYIQAHDDEGLALQRFAQLYPGTTLLVDTYDTLACIRKVIDLKRQLKEHFHVQAVRLDSGDLGALARAARRMLDEAGLEDVKIIVSGNLDEHKVSELLARGAPIDGFGVGTRMAVVEDVPTVDMAYKLVQYAGKPRVKLSLHKESYPSRKQVWRVVEGGQAQRDILGRYDEQLEGQPLLQCVMQKGARTNAGKIALHEAREQTRAALATLPQRLRELNSALPPYPVQVSPRLEADLEMTAR